jgi:ribosomal protein L36
MAAMEVLLPVHGSHKRWTSGYEEIDDLTLRRLLVEVNFALRSIEFELSVREIEPSPRSTTTKSTSENTLVKPSYLKSQKAKEKMIRREDKLSVIYGKIQNTADKIKQNGLSDFAVVPGSERAQLLIDALRIIMETNVNAAIPSHDNWTSDTHSAMLWMIIKCAGPAHMLLVLHSLSPRQFRKLGVHAAARLFSTWYKIEASYLCAP